MPGAAEPAKGRAEPGSLDLLRGLSGKHPLRSRAAGSSASGWAAQYAARNADVPDGAFRPVCGWTVDSRIGSGIPLVVHAVRVGSLSAYGPMRAG